MFIWKSTLLLLFSLTEPAPGVNECRDLLCLWSHSTRFVFTLHSLVILSGAFAIDFHRCEPTLAERRFACEKLLKIVSCFSSASETAWSHRQKEKRSHSGLKRREAWAEEKQRLAILNHKINGRLEIMQQLSCTETSCNLELEFPFCGSRRRRKAHFRVSRLFFSLSSSCANRD